MSSHIISDEDKELFRQSMGLVKPIKKSKKIVETPIRTPIYKKNSAPLRTPSVAVPAVCLSDYVTEEVQSESILSYCSYEIPEKRLRELKQGKIQREARLDLHGLRPEPARDSLLRFISAQVAMDHRSLLIIHGKGGRSGETPILKNLINHWLKQIPEVLAFHSALPKDGGAGALYVLLKRNSTQFVLK